MLNLIPMDFDQNIDVYDEYMIDKVLHLKVQLMKEKCPVV